MRSIPSIESIGGRVDIVLVPADAHDDVLAALSHVAALDERRVASRRQLVRPVPVTLVDMMSGAGIDGQLVDVSASGVGVRLTKPVEPGLHFLLVLPSQPGIRTPLRYRVRRCVEVGEGWFHAGAAFVRARG
jgi:hypothetical protein